MGTIRKGAAQVLGACRYCFCTRQRRSKPVACERTSLRCSLPQSVTQSLTVEDQGATRCLVSYIYSLAACLQPASSCGVQRWLEVPPGRVTKKLPDHFARCAKEAQVSVLRPSVKLGQIYSQRPASSVEPCSPGGVCQRELCSHSLVPAPSRGSLPPTLLCPCSDATVWKRFGRPARGLHGDGHGHGSLGVVGGPESSSYLIFNGTFTKRKSRKKPVPFLTHSRSSFRIRPRPDN